MKCDPPKDITPKQLAFSAPKIPSEKSHLYLWCPNALLAWGASNDESMGL
jgi:hypothetical protein